MEFNWEVVIMNTYMKPKPTPADETTLLLVDDANADTISDEGKSKDQTGNTSTGLRRD